MNFLKWTVAVAIVGSNLLCAQEKKQPPLRMLRAADRTSYAPKETVNLRLSLESMGNSHFWIYRNVEWGWAGIGFVLYDSTNHPVDPRAPLIPLPPPPWYDKSRLAELRPGHFYGAYLSFKLSRYDLKEETYYLQVSYPSNDRLDQSFGLPIIASNDGKLLSEKMRLEVGNN